MQPLTLEEVGEKMITLLPILLRELSKRTSDELTRGQITLPQMLILQHFLQKDRSKMRELAELLNVSTSAVTGFVDRAQTSGLLKREYATEDRRIIWVSITTKGKKVVQEVLAQRKQMFIRIFEQMSTAERDQYVRTFEKICQILAKDRVR